MTRYERWEVHDVDGWCHMRFSDRARAERFIVDYAAAVVRAGGEPLQMRIVHLVEACDDPPIGVVILK